MEKDLSQADNEGGPRSGSDERSMSGDIAIVAHTARGCAQIFGAVEEKMRNAAENVSRKQRIQ